MYVNPVPILVWATFLVLALVVSPAWFWALGLWTLFVVIVAVVVD